MDDVHRNDARVWRTYVVVYAVGRNRMKIIVDEKPLRADDCLFKVETSRDYYPGLFYTGYYYVCPFTNESGKFQPCSISEGKQCVFLKELSGETE